MSWWEEFRFAFGKWRTNFWFLPALINAAVIGLFVFIAWLDHHLSSAPAYIASLPYWFSGTPNASRSLLSAIATIMGTVATVVFSISVLTLQMASAQYTPRLLRSFTRSAVGQVTMGILIGTIVYSLLTLSIVREPTSTQTIFVPDISVNIAKLMALLSLALLIYYIGYIAILISASHIIKTARQDTMEAYRRYTKQEIGKPAPPPVDAHGIVTPVDAEKSGFVERLRMPALESAVREVAARTRNREIWVMARVTIGDYVKKGDTLAEIFADSPASDNITKSVKDSFAIGVSRQPDSDFRYGIDELYSIALRRSNQLDSSTAVECVVALTEVWLQMVSMPLYPPNRWIRVRDTQVHLSLIPVDIDNQIAESLQRLFENSTGQAKLLDLSTAIIEALSTVARESAVHEKPDTFDACWPGLQRSVIEMVRMTEDEHLLHRIEQSLTPLRDVLCRLDPGRWDTFASELRQSAESSRKAASLAELWN